MLTKKPSKQQIKKGFIYVAAILVGLSLFLYLTCEGEPEAPLEERHPTIYPRGLDG